MSNQEKRGNVIKALELCTSKIETRTRVPCEVCPYHNEEYHGVLGDGCCNMRSLQCDMLALLKEEEAVKPYLDIDEAKCPICKVKLTRQELLGDNVLFEDFFDYCPHCGRKVKWE